MKSNVSIILSGIILIAGGGILFYSLEGNSNLDAFLRSLKHWGTFAGLSGIGVVIAGILLTLTKRQQSQNPEDLDGLE